MTKYEKMKIRRTALKWSKEKLAEEAGINIRYIDFYEEGKNIGRDFEYKITQALYNGTKSLDYLDHYRFRIMELSLMIQIEEDTTALIKELAHLGVEVNKFQMDIIDADSFYKV